MALDNYKAKQVAMSETQQMILPALVSVMKLDLVVNEQSDIWLLHDKPLGGVLRWVEYDAYDASVTLVMADGKTQSSGLKIHKDMASWIKGAQSIYTVLTDGQKVSDMYKVPMIVRH